MINDGTGELVRGLFYNQKITQSTSRVWKLHRPKILGGLWLSLQIRRKLEEGNEMEPRRILPGIDSHHVLGLAEVAASSRILANDSTGFTVVLQRDRKESALVWLAECWLNVAPVITEWISSVDWLIDLTRIFYPSIISVPSVDWLIDCLQNNGAVNQSRMSCATRSPNSKFHPYQVQNFDFQPTISRKPMTRGNFIVPGGGRDKRKLHS